MMSENNSSLARQHGAVLIIALLALVAITMSALALMRTRDTTTLIAGNMAFRKMAVAGADRAVELARTWLLANETTLASSKPADGFYALFPPDLDITGFQSKDNTNDISWDASGSQPYKAKVVNVTPDATTGLQLSYIIFRLCANDNKAATATDCAAYEASADTSQSSKTVSSYGGGALTGSRQVYYRIIARARGAKNTTSFVETIILL